MAEDIDEGIVGELCVSLRHEADGLIACPLLKGTGQMRVFESAAGFVRLSGQRLSRGDAVLVERFRN